MLIDGFITVCHCGNEDLWQTCIKCVTVIGLQKFNHFSPSPLLLCHHESQGGQCASIPSPQHVAQACLGSTGMGSSSHGIKSLLQGANPSLSRFGCIGVLRTDFHSNRMQTNKQCLLETFLQKHSSQQLGQSTGTTGSWKAKKYLKHWPFSLLCFKKIILHPVHQTYLYENFHL